MPGNWIDPDDAPELDDEWFEKAEVRVGDKVIRKGRPPGSTKDAVSLRLDQAVLDHFRAGGPGWERPDSARASTRRVLVSTTG